MSEHPLQVNRRLLIARELVETEESYVAQLQAVVELYIAPLRAQLAPSSAAASTGKPILTGDEIKCLFRNIETLSVMHAKFHSDLKSKFQVFTTSTDEKQHVISDVFLKFVPFFLLYTEFANHHVRCTTPPLLPAAAATFDPDLSLLLWCWWFVVWCCVGVRMTQTIC